MSSIIRQMVRGTQDLQKLRIASGNRCFAQFCARLNINPGTDHEALEAEKVKVLNAVKASHKRMTDGVVGMLPKSSKFVSDGVVCSLTELALVDSYVKLEAMEVEQNKAITKALKGIPIYDEFLSQVNGCGPLSSAVIISEIDIGKAKYASSLWRLAGYDVAKDGQGRSRRKEHLEEVSYTDRQGDTVQRKSLTFNPMLKTKLYLLGTSFLKVKESPYKDVYYDYKNRLENHATHKDKTKGHRHNMAIRYMVKRFLVDLYIAWRTLEGLEVHKEYSEAKLGYQHKSQ